MTYSISNPIVRFAALTTGGAAIVLAFFFGTLYILDTFYPATLQRKFDIKSLPRQVGNLSPDGTAKATAGIDPAGFLSFGPYVDIGPGSFIAVIDVICDSGVNYAEVWTLGAKTYGKKNFECKASKERLSIPFQLTQKVIGLEIRVMFGGKGVMQLLNLRLDELK